MLRPKQLSLLNDARLVTRLVKKGLVRQAVEIVTLKTRNPGLGATDYYTYGLYDSSFIGDSRVEDFVGWREEAEIAATLNVRNCVAPAWDKFTLTVFCHYFGLPMPRLVAFYRSGPPPISAIADAHLDSPERLTTWLRTQPKWPLFVKPSFGGRGINCHHLVGYRADTDALVMKDASEMPVEQFVSNVIGDTQRPFYYRREMGYLFQEVLRPHAAIRDLVGNDAISGIRFMVIQDALGAELVASEWKIVTGNNVIDNQRSWTTGNLSGEIDWATGRLRKVIEGDWPRAKVFDRHPQTLRPFTDFVLPHWDAALALCKRAAAVFPLMRIQHWDVAITDRGPMLLEVNEAGSIVGEQQWGRGVLTPRFRDLLKTHGDPRKHQLIKRLAPTGRTGAVINQRNGESSNATTLPRIKQTALLENARLVASRHGKGLLRQAMEIRQIKRINPSLDATDYYAYRLYDEQSSPASAEAFLGRRRQTDLALTLNHDRMVMPARDKFTFAMIADAFALPVPRLLALYRSGPPPIPGIADVVLNAPDALSKWLRNQRTWPLFAKPSYDQQGFCCYTLIGYEQSADALVINDGRRIPIDQFVSEIVGSSDRRYHMREMGFLFQEVLRPHPDIARIHGNDAISVVRLLLVHDAHGTDFVTAMWKLATGNDDDNLRSGKAGSLLAEVDLESGRISGALNGDWPHADIVTRIEKTGRVIEGFVLPEWPEVLAMSARAAPIFPLMRIQQWDVAITDRGPRFLALNDTGHVEAMQRAGKGILTKRVRSMLSESGGNRFPWITKVRLR